MSARNVNFEPQSEPLPPLRLDLVDDDLDVTVERFDSGLVVWCSMARRHLRHWDADEGLPGWDAATWDFLCRNSASHFGTRAVDVAVAAERLAELLDSEIERISLGTSPHLAYVERMWGFFPSDLERFLHEWSDPLWRAIGALLFERRDRATVRGPVDESSLAMLRENWTGPAPEPIRLRSARSDHWSDETVVDVVDGLNGLRDEHDEPSQEDLDALFGPDHGDRRTKVVAELRQKICEGASLVYYQQPHEALGRQIYGIDQQTLARRQGPAIRPLQRRRIFLAWRRVAVAIGLGEIAPRIYSNSTGTPAWARARTLVSGFAALAREALTEFEAPNLDELDPEQRKKKTNSMYNEARRAVGHLLYMLEQVFDAEGQPELAQVFGAMLNDYARDPKAYEDPDPTAPEGN